MADLKQGMKQCLKKILISKQHKLYEKEVNARNLSYDRWIREKEEKLGIAESILARESRSLTNDFLNVFFGQERNQNEGNDAEFVEKCPKFEIQGLKMACMPPRTALFRNINEEEKVNSNTDVILIPLYKGQISEKALDLLAEGFEKDKNIILIYGDEDVQEKGTLQEKPERSMPWFKPDWSPDRFLSCFYFGGLVAVRADAFLEAAVCCKEEGLLKDTVDPLEGLYQVLFEMIRMHGGFSKRSIEEAEGNPTKVWQGEQNANRMSVYHIRQVLYHSSREGYEQIKELALPGDAEQELLAESRYGKEGSQNSPLLSIIIPSKDNPEVLFQCVRSLIERTVTSYSYEMIVVDNGSTGENRKNIMVGLARISMKPGFMGCRYLYQPMVFNFSRMCNMGAKEAKGSLLLFLNDDMEILQENWMDLMIEKALLPYVGGVGAKLLYPDSRIIQHAGITNLRVGPAHKLQFLNDEQVHYHGMNRGVHNMLGATGACLMMRKDVFEEAGGFCEELAVAFNDVDLCYTIYEKGYYNVVRNDVVLYHHESLSRGKDGESEEKQLRLLREKDVLYERHQDIYGRDPFYHPYLTTDMLESEYSPAYRYQVTLDMPWAKAALCTEEVQGAREDKCLVVGMECAMDIYKWKYGVSPQKGKVKLKPEEMGYYFQGYSFVIGADNACYKKKLLLKNKENGCVWGIPVDERYRQDIKKNLSDQLNVDLTGFASKVQKQIFPPGIYQFGMLASDQCSRQKLVNWSSWVLEVSADE